MKCSHTVADMLANLCTYRNALPLGSQVSMRLSFFANMDMFDELYSLAQQNDLRMTLYVDDLTFSGNKIPKGFKGEVTKIIHRYGHRVKNRKSKFYYNNIKEITGVIVNNGSLTIPHRKLHKLHKELKHLDELLRNPITDEILIDRQKTKVFGLLEHTGQFYPRYHYIKNY